MIEQKADKKFPKTDKLCSNKDIEELFLKGKSFIVYPLRVVYYFQDVKDIDKYSISVLISVSKKKFKRAVKRNRIKRLIRESYRLNKNDLIINNKSLNIAFIYLKDTLPKYEEIDNSVWKILKTLSEKAGEGRNEENII